MNEIRKLGLTDLEEFKSLLLLSLHESPLSFSDDSSDIDKKHDDYFQERLLPGGSDEENFVLGAFSPALLSMVSFRRDNRLKARHKAHLFSMYTDSSNRGHGLGGLLLKWMIDYSKKDPELEQIHTWVLCADTDARNFYLRHGFRSQGVVSRDLKVEERYIDSEYLVLYLEKE